MVWKSNFDCTTCANVRFQDSTTTTNTTNTNTTAASGPQGVPAPSAAHVPHRSQASELHGQVRAGLVPLCRHAVTSVSSLYTLGDPV